MLSACSFHADLPPLFVFLEPVVRRLDSAMHRIAIFGSLLKLSGFGITQISHSINKLEFL